MTDPVEPPDRNVEADWWQDRAEMVERESRRWREWYDKCSDALHQAEAERDQLLEQQAALSARLKASEAELCRMDGLAGDYQEEADRLREALQQIVDWTGLTPTSVLRVGVREFARRAVLATTEEPNP